MSRAKALLDDIIKNARIAEALVKHPESKQALIEIRLAARCVAQSETAEPASRRNGESAPRNIVRLHD